MDLCENAGHESEKSWVHQNLCVSHHTFQNLISALASADHVRVTRRQDQGPELTIIASDVKPWQISLESGVPWVSVKCRHEWVSVVTLRMGLVSLISTFSVCITLLELTSTGISPSCSFWKIIIPSVIRIWWAVRRSHLLAIKYSKNYWQNPYPTLCKRCRVKSWKKQSKPIIQFFNIHEIFCWVVLLCIKSSNFVKNIMTILHNAYDNACWMIGAHKHLPTPCIVVNCEK